MSSGRRLRGALALSLLAIAVVVEFILLSSPRSTTLLAPLWAVVVVVPLVVVASIRARSQGAGTVPGRIQRRRTLAAVAVLVGVLLVAWSFDLPLQARFALSRPAFGRARDAALDRPDGYRTHDGRIGLYRVESVDAEDGSVWFAIGGDETADHDYGFACLTRSAARSHLRYDMQVVRHLTGCWYLTSESTD